MKQLKLPFKNRFKALDEIMSVTFNTAFNSAFGDLIIPDCESNTIYVNCRQSEISHYSGTETYSWGITYDDI